VNKGPGKRVMFKGVMQPFFFKQPTWERFRDLEVEDTDVVSDLPRYHSHAAHAHTHMRHTSFTSSSSLPDGVIPEVGHPTACLAHTVSLAQSFSLPHTLAHAHTHSHDLSLHSHAHTRIHAHSPPSVVVGDGIDPKGRHNLDASDRVVAPTL
jgi:hypothetical protein